MTFSRKLRWRQGPRCKAESTRADHSLAHSLTLSHELIHSTEATPSSGTEGSSGRQQNKVDKAGQFAELALWT